MKDPSATFLFPCTSPVKRNNISQYNIMGASMCWYKWPNGNYSNNTNLAHTHKPNTIDKTILITRKCLERLCRFVVNKHQQNSTQSKAKCNFIAMVCSDWFNVARTLQSHQSQQWYLKSVLIELLIITTIAIVKDLSAQNCYCLWRLLNALTR